MGQGIEAIFVLKFREKFRNRGCLTHSQSGFREKFRNFLAKIGLKPYGARVSHSGISPGVSLKSIAAEMAECEPRAGQRFGAVFDPKMRQEWRNGAFNTAFSYLVPPMLPRTTE